MGVVWKAHDELLDRTVAVKEVRYSAALGEDVQTLNRRMMREARAAARLTHPNVVVVYDVIEENEQPWIVMQLVPSRSLGQVLREDGPLPPRRVAEIGLALLGALHGAHDAGVLHRDVKPENVLLADNGRVVLTDFGIATLDSENTLTMTGVAGTPAFIAPERLRGLPARRESDLWSLGATLYAAVEGRSPHDRKLPLPTMHSVLTDPPDPARNAGPLLPVLEGLLRKEPVQRLTYEEAAALLRRVAEGRSATQPWTISSITGPRDGSAEPQAAPERRRPYGQAAVPGTPARDEQVPPAARQEPGAPAEREAAPRGEAGPRPEAAPAAGAAAAAPEIPQTGQVAKLPPPQDSAPAAPAVPETPAAPETPAPRTSSAAGEDPAAEEAPASSSATRKYVRDLAARSTPPTPPVPPAGVPAPAPAPEPREPATALQGATAIHPADQEPTLLGTLAPGRLRLVLPIVLVALIIVAGVGVWIGMNSDSPGAAGQREPGTAEPDASPSEGTGGSGSPGPSGSAESGTGMSDSSPSPSGTGEDDKGGEDGEDDKKGDKKGDEKKEEKAGGKLPDGWRTHKDSFGFSVGLPKGWKVTKRRGTQVTFSLPSDRRSFLMIEYTDSPGPDAKKDWDVYEPQARGGFPGYELIGIKRVDYMEDAADWEFTWRPSYGKARVINRGFLTKGGRGYAIYWHTLASDWKKNLKLFEGFTETFSSKK
ncbi:protein kinase [Planobispora longispora]